MSQPANDEFSQHLSDDEESNHEDASDTGVAHKQNNNDSYKQLLSQYLTPLLKKSGNSRMRISTGKDGIVKYFHQLTAAEIQAVERKGRLTHGAEVSTEDANHKFLRSLPPAWSNLAMTMRTNPEIDTLSIDDLYNNLRVFEQEIQGASKTSSSAQNVAFVSQSKSSTNKVKSGFTGAYSTCTPSTSSTNIPEKEVLAGFADEVIYSLFAKQSEDWDLLHEDLEQIDDVDIEEMDINWQIAMIAIRMKKFYKKTGRRVRVDGKTPIERDSFYQHQEAGKQEKNQMGLLTMDDGIVNWGEHTEVEETNHALMAIGSSNEVTLCSKTCIDSYNTLKTLCDEQMNQLGDSRSKYLPLVKLKWQGNAEVKRPVQLNAGRPKVNSVRPNINTGRTNINSIRPKVNVVSSNINTVRSRQPVVPFAKTDSTKSQPLYAANGNVGIAVKNLLEHPLKNMVDRGIFDSGCSGHIDGNKVQLELLKNCIGGICYLWSFDMKTPTPAKGFACLIAKATSDESKLWHRSYKRFLKKLLTQGTSSTKSKKENDIDRTLQQEDEVNTRLSDVNTGRLDDDNSPMPELKIFHKSKTGIFDEASYDEEGVITDFNSLPTETEVNPTPTLRIHSIQPKSQILGDPKSVVQTRSKVQKKSRAHALLKPKRLLKLYKMTVGFHAMQKNCYNSCTNKYGFLVDLTYGMKRMASEGILEVFKNMFEEPLSSDPRNIHYLLRVMLSLLDEETFHGGKPLWIAINVEIDVKQAGFRK
ncbi:hypothetical protein Tco_1328032 [Tanacetum coccineum]